MRRAQGDECPPDLLGDLKWKMANGGMYREVGRFRVSDRRRPRKYLDMMAPASELVRDPDRVITHPAGPRVEIRTRDGEARQGHADSAVYPTIKARARSGPARADVRRAYEEIAEREGASPRLPVGEALVGPAG